MKERYDDDLGHDFGDEPGDGIKAPSDGTQAHSLPRQCSYYIRNYYSCRYRDQAMGKQCWAVRSCCSAKKRTKKISERERERKKRKVTVILIVIDRRRRPCSLPRPFGPCKKRTLASATYVGCPPNQCFVQVTGFTVRHIIILWNAAFGFFS